MAFKMPTKIKNGPAKVVKPPRVTDTDERSFRTVSVRMTEAFVGMVSHIKYTVECDQSEAVKRAVRHEFLALSYHNSWLTVVDKEGNETQVPLMKDGVPI